MSLKFLTMLTYVVLVAACTQNEQVSEDTEIQRNLPQVYTVNYPLAYFAERIAGDSVNVVFPTPPDIDPAFWSPDAFQCAEKSQLADIDRKYLSLPLPRDDGRNRVGFCVRRTGPAAQDQNRCCK